MVFLGYISSSRIWKSYSSSDFSFLRNLSCSPQWLYQFTFPPTVHEGSLFSIPSPEFIVFFWWWPFWPIPRSGRPPGGGNGNSLQYSCRENPMDTGVWWATVHRVTKSQTQLSTHAWLILTSVRRYLTVALVLISLIISDVEHLFMCLLDLCMSSLERCLFRSSTHFFFIVFFFFFFWATWAVCIFWRLILCPLLHLQIFSSMLRIVFLSCL